MNIFILLACAVLGFWLVGVLFDKRKAEADKSSRTRREAPSDSKPDPEPARQAEDPVREACRILDLNRPFTAEQLRAAYRQRISQYHPDKVSGLGPELREIAERKAKEINVAFDLLQRHAQ